MCIFYEYFSQDDGAKAANDLNWEKKEDNFEQIVVHINYTQLYQNSTTNVKQFLEFICDHPSDITRAMALALDSVRLYVLG